MGELRIATPLDSDTVLPVPGTVKPGWRTTEFLAMLLSWLANYAVQKGWLSAGDAPVAVQACAQIVAGAVTMWYIASRAKVKIGAALVIALLLLPSYAHAQLMPWRSQMEQRVRALEQGGGQPRNAQTDPALLAALNSLAQGQQQILAALQQHPSQPPAAAQAPTMPIVMVMPGQQPAISVPPGQAPAISIPPGTQPAISIPPGMQPAIVVPPSTQPAITVQPSTSSPATVQPGTGAPAVGVIPSTPVPTQPAPRAPAPSPIRPAPQISPGGTTPPAPPVPPSGTAPAVTVPTVLYIAADGWRPAQIRR